jgi:hypothetical protein
VLDPFVFLLAAGENSIPSCGLDSAPKDFLLFAQDFLGPWSSFRELVEPGFHSTSSSLRFFILGFAFLASENRRPAWFCVRSDLKFHFIFLGASALPFWPYCC